MDFDQASYRLESTLLLFRNNTPVPLFRFRVRTAQQSQTRSLSLAQFRTCRWTMQNWSDLVKFIFLMLGGSFERKTSSEDRKAITMENVEPTQDFRSLQSENQFQVCYQCSPCVHSAVIYVCILILQHQGKWMSFLTKLITLTEPYCSVWKSIATFVG